MTLRPSPPLWFVVLAGVALALVARALVAVVPSHGSSAGELAPPALAFLAFLIPIVSAIWTGIQVAAKVTLTVLSWSVKALWFFATTIYKGALELGKLLGKGFREAWHFLRATYTHVLKPAWTKFWKFVEHAKKWLEKYVGPVLKFLNKIRARLLKFYEDWIRPVLDTIGVARRVLDLLARLGVDWARKLDEKLAWLEQKIDGTFRLVLGKLNEVINVVDRVITADGLFQRLALIRSIERDLRYVSRAIANWRDKPLTAEDYQRIRENARNRTLERARTDLAEGVTTGGGYHRAVISEMTEQWRIYLGV